MSRIRISMKSRIFSTTAQKMQSVKPLGEYSEKVAKLHKTSSFITIGHFKAALETG